MQWDRINISRDYFKGGGNCCWIFHALQHKLYISLCGWGGTGGRGGQDWQFGTAGSDETYSSWPGHSKWHTVCTALLYISVRGDSALKSNYTTITGSLIKPRATRLIQPCDPAERAHSSLHHLDMIQSVLQRHSANWWCCRVSSVESQLQLGLWHQSHITPSNYPLISPAVSRLIKWKCFWKTFFLCLILSCLLWGGV